MRAWNNAKGQLLVLGELGGKVTSASKSDTPQKPDFVILTTKLKNLPLSPEPNILNP